MILELFVSIKSQGGLMGETEVLTKFTECNRQILHWELCFQSFDKEFDSLSRIVHLIRRYDPIMNPLRSQGIVEPSGLYESESRLT